MREKIYKHTTYQITTEKFCGAVTIDQDRTIVICDTAPCYKWMVGKQFNEILNYLKYKKILISCEKIGVEIYPF